VQSANPSARLCVDIFNIESHHCHHCHVQLPAVEADDPLLSTVIAGYDNISIQVALIEPPAVTYVSLPSFVHEHRPKLAEHKFFGSEVSGRGTCHDCVVDNDSGEPLVVVVGDDQDLRIGSVEDFCIVCEE